MENIRRINLTIGLDVYMNCLLVRAGLRNAMLIQPADYKEVISTEPITTAKLKALKKTFPELIQSDIGGETIISKKPYTETDIKRPSDMGKILGFPCATDYKYTLDHPDEPKTSIDIQVNLKPGGNDDSVQIVAYVCRDDKSYNDARYFAEKAEKILKADPVIGKIVKDVTATKNTIMSPKYLINELLTNKVLNEQDQEQMINYVSNLGLESANMYKYNFKNPIHRGILIGLLSNYDNNPIEPFYPLQYRAEGKKVEEITEKWDKALQGIFAIPTNGGGRRKNMRKTRKQIAYF
jgi:hypothetical protein